MSAHYVLIVTTHGLVIWRNQDEVRLDVCFDPHETEAFSHWLGMHSNATFHLLADIADERFQIEPLPALRHHERRALLARKLQKHFPDALFSMVRLVDGDKTTRSSTLSIFSALPASQALSPWLDILRAQAVPLAGIYTPPLLMHRMLDKAAAKTPQLLLVTMSRGGLRQSLFRSGRLLFSRLLPIDSPEEGAAILRAETLRLHQYLLGQRLLNSDHPLPVQCLVETTHIDMLRRVCHVDDNHIVHGPLTFHFDDLNTRSGNLGLTCRSSAPCLDHLLAHLLMQHPPRCQFGNANIRRPYRLRQWRYALDGCTALLLLCTALVIPASIVSAHQSHARQMAAEAVMAEAQHQHAHLSATLPPTDISLETLTQRIVQWQNITSRSPALLASLQRVSQALPSGLELQRLEWRTNLDNNSVSMDMTLHELPLDNSYDDLAGRFAASLRQSQASEVRLDMPAMPLREAADRIRAFQIHVLDTPTS